MYVTCIMMTKNYWRYRSYVKQQIITQFYDAFLLVEKAKRMDGICTVNVRKKKKKVKQFLPTVMWGGRPNITQ